MSKIPKRKDHLLPDPKALLDPGVLSPQGTAARKPLKASPADLTAAQAYVDPSRLFASGLFMPFNPSVLVTRKGLKVFDQMSLDEQVKICMAFKVLAVLAPGWEVKSPSDQADDWEVRQFVADVFKHLPGGFSLGMKKIMRALRYGYSVVEKIYGEGVGPLEGKVVLKKLNECKPHYFDFDVDAYGEIIAVVQILVPGAGGAALTKAGNSYPPDKFVVYSYDIEHENPYGKSDLEAAYRPWWVKDNAYKWLAILLERYGIPPLFLFYDSNAYQGNQIEELKKVVRNIQNATMGLLPRSSEKGLEFWREATAGTGRDIFLAALGRFDADIAKALLQPSHLGVTTETREQGSGGSMARSNVHFKGFMMVITEQQRELAQIINSQVIPQLCDLNYPSLKSYPELEFLDVDDDTEVQIFTLWNDLVTGKVVNRIEDDERHIRKALGMPENEGIVLEPLPADAMLEAKAKADAEAAKQPKKVPFEEQSAEMRTFAEENKGTWLEVQGHQICVRGQ